MVRQSRASGWGCLLRALRAYVVFMAAAIGLAVASGYWMAARRVAQVDAAWAREAEPMETFLDRFPAAPNSAAATTLDEMTRPLGIRMMLRPSDPPGWKGANEELLKAAMAAMGAIERPRRGSNPSLPPDFVAFLGREKERLDGIVAHILDGGPIVWERDFRKGNGAPLPSLLGHRQLSSLMLGRAWISARNGRGADAERLLEASWRLNASYLERPDLLSQLIGISVGRMQHGVLRDGPGLGAPWRQRMVERPFARRLAVALQLDAANWMIYARGFWGVLDVSEMEDARPPRGGWRVVPRLLTTPYVRMSVAGISGVLLGATRELGAERRCDRDMEVYGTEILESFPRWNIIGRIATPPLVRAWTSFREADLDRELTERVLLARSERATSGRWPTAGGASAVCEGLSWDYETASGSLDIRASAQPFQASSGWDWSVRVRP